MCRLSGLSRASLYRPPRRESEWEMNLRNALHEAALDHPFYGYRRLTPELKQHGWQVGETRIRRLMREDNLLRLRQRRTKKTTDSTHGLRVYPNLACDVTPTGLNQLWAADITYIRLWDTSSFTRLWCWTCSRAASWVGRSVPAWRPSCR